MQEPGSIVNKARILQHLQIKSVLVASPKQSVHNVIQVHEKNIFKLTLQTQPNVTYMFITSTYDLYIASMCTTIGYLILQD